MQQIEEWLDILFTEIPSIYLIVGSSILFVGMGLFAFVVRSKAAEKPITAKRIILPPVMMSTGAFMFLFEPFQVSLIQAVEALIVGLLFSIVLIKTTKFERRGEHIYVQKSKALLLILLGLLLIRFTAKLVLSKSIDVGELGGMFWLLAFGMIVPWRVTMFRQYKRLHAQQSI